MQAGVDDEAACTKQRRRELAELAFRITLVPSGLDGELLRVERPAFGERRDTAERAGLTKARQRRVFLFERDLEVMSGDRLVIDERSQAHARHALLPQRNLEDRGS